MGLPKVEFGLSFLPDASPQMKVPAAYFRDALELSVLADQAKLRTIKMTEHYLHAYGGYCPNPLSFLAAVAAKTQQIRLLTGCILPVFHHPLQIAGEAAMVDAISGGRVEIGFARAYLPYEFENFGISMDESRDRFGATVDAVLKLWKEESVSIQTPFFSLKNASVWPRPVQKPHPPVWAAAVRSRESFAWIGSKGMRLLVTSLLTPLDKLNELISIYRETYREGCHDNKEPSRVLCSVPLLIAETDRQAFEEGEHYMRRYLEVWADAAKSWNWYKSSDYPGYSGMSSIIRGTSPEDMWRKGNAVMGCPARVLQAIYRFISEVDVDEISWQIDFGAMDGETARRTLRLLAEQVLPRV